MPSAFGPDQPHAFDAAIFRDEIVGFVAFENADRRRRANGGDERLHDRGARPVARDAHDALFRMRGFFRQHVVAFEIAIERHAVAQQIANAIRAFVGNDPRDLGVDDAAAGFDRVGGVLCRAVAFADRRGDTALRPHARRAFAERRRGDDGNRQGREFQRREKTGEAGTDDHDIAWRPARLRRG